MNDRSGRCASTAKKIGTSATLLLAVIMVLACLGSAAMAIGGEVPAGTIVLVVRGTAPRPPGSDLPTASNPIPGIDIIVQKKPNPPNPTIVVPVDASGTFSVQLKEPGNYTVSTACRAGGCPAIALSLNVAGKVLNPDADGAAGYNFTVGQGGLDLGGQIFVRGAQPIIVNGKSVTPRGVWDDTDIVHGIKIVEIKGDQSPEKVSGAASLGPPSAALWRQTGRPGVIAYNESPRPTIHVALGDINGDGVADEIADLTRPTDILPGAAINTTRDTPGVVISLPFVPGGGTPGIATKEAGTKDSEQRGLKIAENESPRPTTRGTAPHPTGGDGTAGISDQAAAGGLTSYSTAPPPKENGDDPAPMAGDPIPGVDVKLGKNPGGSIAVAKTGEGGTFRFTDLAPGMYELTVTGLPPRSVTVGVEGTFGGKLMHGSDGGTTITYTGLEKPLEKPVGGFGSGLGGVPGMGPGMGPGGGMAPPGAAPGMGPMGPGAMGPGGGMR